MIVVKSLLDSKTLPDPPRSGGAGDTAAGRGAAARAIGAAARSAGHEAADDGRQARWGTVGDQSEQGGGVQVVLDQVGEHVVAALADGGEPHVGGGGEVAGGAGGEVGEERAAEAVAFEDAVPGGAGDAARRAAVQE